MYLCICVFVYVCICVCVCECVRTNHKCELLYTYIFTNNYLNIIT